MVTATINVVHTNEKDDGDLADWVRASFPEATIQIVDLSVEGSFGVDHALREGDVLLMDVSGSMLPGADGDRLLHTLRTARLAAPEAPILAAFIEEHTVAHSINVRFEEAVCSVLDAGATDYVRSAITSQAGNRLFRHRVGALLESARHEPDQHPPTGQEDPFRAPWLELYDEATGRLNAESIARALGASLTALCKALTLPYSAVQRTPSAPKYQRALRPVARVLEMLHTSLPDERVRRAWLNRSRDDLEAESPLDVILAGEVGAVVSLLEGAQLGLGA